jgi:hypothetical protein
MTLQEISFLPEGTRAWGCLTGYVSGDASGDPGDAYTVSTMPCLQRQLLPASPATCCWLIPPAFFSLPAGGGPSAPAWSVMDDNIMGGVSSSALRYDAAEDAAVFAGEGEVDWGGGQRRGICCVRENDR